MQEKIHSTQGANMARTAQALGRELAQNTCDEGRGLISKITAEKPARDVGPIGQQAQQLASSINVLWTDVANLQDRIRPVLAPNPPYSVPEVEPPISEMGSYLCKLELDIRKLSGYVRSIMESVEL